MPVQVLGAPLRHRCTACGGSCQGVHVRLADPAERARIEQAAATLGVPDAIHGDVLRMTGGRCVFLGSDALCRIHKELGADQKPGVCSQYPLIGLRVGDVVRVGLDPGCYAGLATSRDGPEVAPQGLVVSKNDLPAHDAAFEDAFLDVTEDPAATVARLLGWLGRAPVRGDALPRGFDARLITRLHAASLDVLVDLPDTSPSLRTALQPALERARTWDAKAPPPWPALTADLEAYAIDVARRMIYLRLAAHAVPSAPAVALLVLAGAVLLGWAQPTPEAFGPGMAAWVRAIRARAFWRALAPDGPTLEWLLRGDAAP